MPSYERFVFSGHESFPLKPLWLKKGYDFIEGKNDFNAPDAVVKLGVGKNMVASIRYWLKATGLLNDNGLTEISHFLLSNKDGRDPFLEDSGTLWLLHYMLVSSKVATLYNIVFVNLQRERLSFERQNVLSLVRRTMTEDGKIKTYNENTVKKDVGVLIQNYLQPLCIQSMDEYSYIFQELDLIKSSDGKQYYFNVDGKCPLPEEILLYAIIEQSLGNRNIEYDFLRTVGLMFCLSDSQLITMLLSIQEKYPNYIKYSETAGLRQIQVLRALEPMCILKTYYQNEKL